MTILTIDDIRTKLHDRRLEVVATATGLHYNTLRHIRDTKQTNVKYETLEKLSAYFLRDCECIAVVNGVSK
jgi:DNA-binding Xre family transcriptional regulator